MTDLNRPLLGEPDAPCRTCGAALAADQRYCLQCGERRAEARLAFLDILGGRASTPPAAAVAATTTATRRSPAALVAGLSTNAAAIAGVACLLLAMGIGVLIGGLGDGGTAGAGAPQVISVGGAAPAAAVAPTTAVPQGAAAAGTAATTKGTKKGKAAAAKARAKTKATNKALKSLDTASPQEYQKKSAKLPKVVGTGGKAPAKDNKPAAGGGDFQEIG